MALDFNKPSSWCCEAIYRNPTFNVEAYQDRINYIIGLAENGSPMVRLVWAGDIGKTYSQFFTSWDSFGRGVDTELRAKYKYCTIQIPATPDIIDIPPARWILEEYNHPGQYFESWEAARFNKDGQEIRPEPPPEGYYSHLFTIANHTKECCKEAQANSVVCWGLYRKPDGKDLETLRAAKAKRDKDKEIPLDRPLGEKVLADVAAETASRIQARQDAVNAEVRQYVDENALELIQMFTGVEMTDKMKKFSIPKTHKTTESGLVIPK